MAPERRRQIELLYNAAREHGLDALEGAPPDLRSEVEFLLSGHSKDFTPVSNGDPTETAPIQLGTTLGPYRIDAAIGKGGMGQVFRGTDTRLNRPVAIKTSLAAFDARFEREARAIATLNHPNICTLYDVGPNYLVMELVEGETLADRLKRGRLPLQEVIEIGSQIASALVAAHARGIVHRDMKPANIMMGRMASRSSISVSPNPRTTIR